MNLKMVMEKQKNNIEKSIAEKRDFLADAPKGSLTVKRVGDYYSWCVRNGSSKNKTVYIPKEDRKLAESLAAKRFVEAQLEDELADLKATNAYLQYCTKISKTDTVLSKGDEYVRLLEPYVLERNKKVSEWLSDKYTGPVPNPERLRYATPCDFKVRSKSEQSIVELLLKYRVPFKYEQHLYINGNDMYPDFMIMNPQSHKLYVWEHMGMMDDYNYRIKNLDKIQNYAALGFYLGDNLILTFETNASPLDKVWAEEIILHNFV